MAVSKAFSFLYSFSKPLFPFFRSDRDGYVTDTRNISNQVNSHQTDFEKRLKQLDDVVKTAGIKLNEIFGRSMMNQ